MALVILSRLELLFRVYRGLLAQARPNNVLESVPVVLAADYE